MGIDLSSAFPGLARIDGKRDAFSNCRSRTSFCRSVSACDSISRFDGEDSMVANCTCESSWRNFDALLRLADLVKRADPERLISRLGEQAVLNPEALSGLGVSRC